MMSENHICAAAKAMAQTYTTGSVPLYGKEAAPPGPAGCDPAHKGHPAADLSRLLRGRRLS